MPPPNRTKFSHENPNWFSQLCLVLNLMILNLALPSLKGGEVPVARADPVNPSFKVSKYHADIETISFKGNVLIQ